MELFYLCIFAFVAGLVDSVVGGGGLVQLPALLVLLPPHLAESASVVLGTNKLSSICGTSVAAFQYARRIRIPWRSILPSAATAFLFAAFGVRAVQLMPGEILKPLIFFLLIGVAIYTYVRKDFGSVHAPRFLSNHERLAGVVVGAVIGFYDGFFGPGTGSFLIFVFISLFGFDFLTASASAKVINVATNAAAVIVFAVGGDLLYEIALPMGACNVAGAVVGTRLAVLKGNRFVRLFFLCVVASMIARFGWEQMTR